MQKAIKQIKLMLLGGFLMLSGIVTTFTLILLNSYFSNFEEDFVLTDNIPGWQIAAKGFELTTIPIIVLIIGIVIMLIGFFKKAE